MNILNLFVESTNIKQINDRFILKILKKYIIKTLDIKFSWKLAIMFSKLIFVTRDIRLP